MTPYFLCRHVFKLSKKDEFLIRMRAIKSFDTILFVSSCLQIVKKGRISYYNESNKKFWPHTFCVLIMFKFQKFLSQKREHTQWNFLSQWESNRKFWLSLKLYQTDLILFINTSRQFVHQLDQVATIRFAEREANVNEIRLKQLL